MSAQPPPITTQSELEQLCASVRGSPSLAVDTEFVRENTYYPRLCLIQLATASAIGSVDTLAFEDLSPVLDLLMDTGITKVLHAGRQDLEIFFHLSAAVPTPLFDTQIAADLCGIGEQGGLAAVAAALLDIEIDKSPARTDWSRRPLSDRQVAYALDDVRHLVPIHRMLHDRLRDAGRLAWLDEDCLRLSDEALYRPAPDEIWRRVSGVNRLEGQALRAAQDLAAWREHTAMRRDRPRSWIMRDEVLTAIARRLPQDLAGLDACGTPHRMVQRDGNRLLAIVAASAQGTPEPAAAAHPLDRDERRRADRLMKIVRARAEAMGISAGLLATRRDVTAAVRGTPSGPVFEGWRREQVGERLLEALAEE